MNFKYFFYWKPEIYCICIKKRALHEEINHKKHETFQFCFLSTPYYEYQQTYFRSPFLNWTQGHSLLPKIHNEEIQIAI